MGKDQPRVPAKPKRTKARTLKAEERQQYFDLRQAGLGKMAAASETGVTPKTARRWEAAWEEAGNAPFDNPNHKSPKHSKSLSPDARRALKDFSYFQERYLGRIPLPWQKIAADTIVKLASSLEEEYLVLNCPPGSGKDVSLDTPLLTTKGWTTMGQIKVGEYVFDENGQPTQVVAKSEVFTDHDCYRVESDDGSSVIAGADHEWRVRLDGYGQYGYTFTADYPGKTGPKRKSEDGRVIKTTAELAKKRAKRPQLEVTKPVQFASQDLPIDPYVLGAWLGDGDSAGARMTAAPVDGKWIRSYFEEAGYVTTDQSEDTRFGILGLRKQLRLLGVLDNKHIPEQYLLASPEQRLALLQGLIDTDGHVSPTGHIEFCNTNRNLAEGVQYLVHSLGVKASCRMSRATLYGRDCGPRWRVTFYLKDAARLPRKAFLTRDGVRTPPRYLTVTKVSTVPTQCIQVDSPNHLYLAGKGLMVTHNSSLVVHDIGAWLIARDRGIRICVLSSTEANATKFADQLRRTLEATTPIAGDRKLLKIGMAKDAITTLARDFGRFKPEESGTWTKDKFRVDRPADQAAHKENTVEAFGRKQAFLGGRYDVVICDDIQDPSSVKTKEELDALKEWFTDIAESRLEQGGVLIVNMQRVGADDISHHALSMEAWSPEDDELADPDDVAALIKEREAAGMEPLPVRDGVVRKYRHIVFKAHADGDDCKGAKFHGRNAPAFPDGCLLFPRKLTYQKMETKRRNDPGKFRLWFQQEEVELGNVLVDPVWISGGKDEFGVQRPGCWDNSRGARELPEGLSSDIFSFISIDPSPSQFWAVGWWIFHKPSNELFLIDLVRQKMTSADFFDMNPNTGECKGVMVDIWNASCAAGAPLTHVIAEQNAAQKFMWQSSPIMQYLKMRSVGLMPHTTTAQNKNSQEYGVQGLQPWFRDGRIRLPGRQNDAIGTRYRSMKLVSEATNYKLDGNQTMTDDCVMSTWFATCAVANLYRPKKSLPLQARPSWVGMGSSHLRLVV